MQRSHTYANFSHSCIMRLDCSRQDTCMMACNTSNSSDDDGFNNDMFIAASQQYELLTQQKCVDEELECALEEKYGDLEEEDFNYNSLMKGVTQDGFSQP